MKKSRKKIPDLNKRKFGKVLKIIRQSQRPKKSGAHIALKVYGYEAAKSNISNIERALAPLDEEKLRKWVEALDLDMETFLKIAATHEN
jgi:transcriptional regulator with XRE-family HTH domain